MHRGRRPTIKQAFEEEISMLHRSVPDSFRPRLTTRGKVVRFDVRLSLGFTKTGDRRRDALSRKLLRMAIWQALDQFLETGKMPKAVRRA